MAGSVTRLDDFKNSRWQKYPKRLATFWASYFVKPHSVVATFWDFLLQHLCQVKRLASNDGKAIFLEGTAVSPKSLSNF